MGRQVLGIEQLADLYLHAAIRLSEDYVSRETAKVESPFKSIDKDYFIHERFALVFWIIEKFFADEDGNLIDIIHTLYCEHLGISATDEKLTDEIMFFISRSKEYSEACQTDIKELKPDSFIWLSSVVGKNIFQKEKPVLDLGIMFRINIEINGIIRFLGESIYSKYEIKESDSL